MWEWKAHMGELDWQAISSSSYVRSLFYLWKFFFPLKLKQVVFSLMLFKQHYYRLKTISYKVIQLLKVFNSILLVIWISFLVFLSVLTPKLTVPFLCRLLITAIVSISASAILLMVVSSFGKPSRRIWVWHIKTSCNFPKLLSVLINVLTNTQDH